MAVTLKTWASQAIAPINDALLYDSIQATGVFAGCDVTNAGSGVLHVAAGYGIIRGRLFVVDETDVSLSLTTSGTLNGRLYLHMDLGNTDEPLQLLTEEAETLSDLTHTVNVNTAAGVEDFELATFTVTTTGAEDLVQSFTDLQNMSTLMDMIAAGMSNKTITINSDGSLDEAYTNGATNHIEFGDGVITQTFTDAIGSSHTHTTTFSGSQIIMERTDS